MTDRSTVPARVPAGRAPRRSGAGRTSVKALITAASLAATVGGWAALSVLTPDAPAEQLAAAPNLPPLPTLVPAPSDSARAGTIAGDSAGRSAQPSSRSQALRQVQVPRRPVTRTRSSR